MHTLDGRLLDLVKRLDALGPRPPLVETARALQEAQLTPADLAAYIRPNPRSYNRALVVLREAYELLVLTWLPGQASVPHDHTGSLCAMQIVQGEAVEGCYRVAPDGYADLQFEKALPCGEIAAAQDAGVHTVRNESRTGELLVSVHVYAPPLKDFHQFTPRPRRTGETLPAAAGPLPTVVVVGGGFSGSMAAAQLLRGAAREGVPLEAALVERKGAVGEGVAYGTREPVHLLNVPAGRMSAWPDRPDDFVQWASRRSGEKVSPGAFLPRPWYGEYVRETLLATVAQAGKAARLSVLFDEVCRVARHPAGGWMVHLARGPSLRVEAVVLALGHRPPADPVGGRWSGPRLRLITDPWRPFAMNVVGPDEPVVILGSGLTAVDAVLSLSGQPRQAPITLVSRRGLLPQPHADTPLAPCDLRSLVGELTAAPGGLRTRTLLARVRGLVRQLAPTGVDWRCVVDGLRPHTETLWRTLSSAERRRFLARVRPFWEVHRHRMALPIAERFRALLDRGAVRLVAGRVDSARAEGDRVRLVLRERLEDRPVHLDAAWVVNCTGPLPSNSVESNPVIGSLIVQGLLRPDELSLGIETTGEGNAVAAGGETVPDLFVVGTLRKPASWESTAVPELRQQAAAVAERVLGLLKQRWPFAAVPELHASLPANVGPAV
jgi:uncharacterized NAD(P)/FAD-binding protein YdhS/predicted metal-dependent enzyme (double-stranded beta helix superfamily)